jgi:hypothetical protein
MFADSLSLSGMIRKENLLIAVLFLIIIFGCLGCGKENSIEGLKLQINFLDEKLFDDHLAEIQFTWTVEEGFLPMGQKAKVFVLMWHGSNLLSQEYHAPEVHPSEWKPGDVYSYSRRLYIPEFIDQSDPDYKGDESLRLLVGIYAPYEEGSRIKRDIIQEMIEVSPSPPGIPEIIYCEGWHDVEVDPSNSRKLLRWTEKEAKCIIGNPRRDALLYMIGGVCPDMLGEQKIVLSINGSVLDEFSPITDPFEKSYKVEKDLFGEGKSFELVISVDKVCDLDRRSSGLEDYRELGIRISFLYFR